MKLSKSIISALCLVFVILSNQSFGQSIVELTDDAAMYVQQDKGYILKFDVLATPLEMDAIKAKVAGFSDRLSLEIVSYVDSRYNVIFTVNHQKHPEYVHKMMRACGFKSLIFKGESFDLIKIVEILKSYQ